MKVRLDELLVLRELSPTLKEARALIGAGVVFVNEMCSDKIGTLHDTDDEIRIKKKSSYVSRGGLKLEEALRHFGFDITGAVCIDVGASSGGFTDCLLRHGAAKVYAVDVAYGQFSWKLRQDPRVVVIERFNARHISTKEVPESIDLAVIDASFISLTALIPPLLPLFSRNIEIIGLIKPQFELPREQVGAGGVVRNKESHQLAIDCIKRFSADLGLTVGGVTESPVLGPKGNKEFLIRLFGCRDTAGPAIFPGA